jgi:hypothetical protein
MTFTRVAKELLIQLDDMCQQVGQERYGEPLEILMNASIGGHVRHCIEFFQCLEKAVVHNENVSYDERKRDPRLHSDVKYTCDIIRHYIDSLDNWSMNQHLTLQVSYPYSGVKNTLLETHLNRELVYLIEHLVHHMALIRVGIHHKYQDVVLPKSFGIAQSTLKHIGHEA